MRQIGLRLDDETLRRLDEKCGDMPRERFVRRAVRRALDEDDAVTGFISFDGPATVMTPLPDWGGVGKRPPHPKRSKR